MHIFKIIQKTNKQQDRITGPIYFMLLCLPENTQSTTRWPERDSVGNVLAVL